MAYVCLPMQHKNLLHSHIVSLSLTAKNESGDGGKLPRANKLSERDMLTEESHRSSVPLARSS